MFELNLAELVEDDIKEGVAHKKANGRWAIRTESIIEMRNQGKTYPEISKELGIPEGTISSRISYYKNSKNKATKKHAKRQNEGTTKLIVKSPNESISAEEILSLRNQGKTFREISEMALLNETTVSNRLLRYLDKPENKEKKNKYFAGKRQPRVTVSKLTSRVLTMSDAGMTNSEIANALGMKRKNVANRVAYYKNKIALEDKATTRYREEDAGLHATVRDSSIKDMPKNHVVESPKEQPKLTLAQRIKVLFTGKVD